MLTKTPPRFYLFPSLLLSACSDPSSPNETLQSRVTLEETESATGARPLETADSSTNTELAAKSLDLTTDEVREHEEKTRALQEITTRIAQEHPDAYVGAKVGKPRTDESPSIWIKGPVTPSVRALIKSSQLTISLIDSQPYSHAELNSKTQRIAQTLLSNGITEFKLGNDIARRGVLDLTVRTDKKHEDFESLLKTILDPDDISPGLNISTQDDPVFAEDDAWAGMLAGGCTAGFTVGWGSNPGTGIGQVTAEHCGNITTITHPGSGNHTWTFEAEHYGTYGDVQVFSSNVTDRARYYISSSSTHDVESKEPAPYLGGFLTDQMVCLYSRRQNSADCAYVEDTGNYCGGSGNLVEIDADIAVEGDSGAAYYYNHRAFGIHNCSSNVSGTDGNGWGLMTVADFFDDALGVGVVLD